MKKKFLILLLPLLFILPVKAEEIDSCYDDYIISDYAVLDSGSYYYDNSTSEWVKETHGKALTTIKVLFPVTANKTYNIKFFDSIQIDPVGNYYTYNIYYYDNNLLKIDSISLVNTFNTDTNILSLTIPEDFTGNYISIVLRPTDGQNDTTLDNNTIAFADFDLSTCPEVEEPTPEEPVTPTPEETNQSETISNFYTICIDKINFLTNTFIENKLLLSIPVITILIFIFTLIYRRYISWKN